MGCFGEGSVEVRVFLDFDGTVSQVDVVDAILESFADPGWRRIEEEWRVGHIGSRECLRAQMSLVCASERDMNALLDRIELDDGFVDVLQTCARHAVPLHILSDGFDYCIERILGRHRRELGALLSDVGISASHLEPHGDRAWRANFPFFAEGCAHGCATCKPAAMRVLRAGGSEPAVFVGDGLSDRYAARAADMVFAKNALADYCKNEGIVCTRYQHLGQVALAIEGMLHDSAIGALPDRITRGRSWVR